MALCALRQSEVTLIGLLLVDDGIADDRAG